PATLKLHGLSLRSALKLLLEPQQLAYIVKDDSLKITTSAGATSADSIEKEIIAARGNRMPNRPPPGDRAGTRVQAVRGDGNRLTFFAERFADDALLGTSDVLGACRVGLKQVDQLLFGAAIEQAAAQLAYQQWKLQNAIEPKFVQSGDSEG